MRISVITPSLNQGRYLAECLQSVLSQGEVSTIEHLVMDGGSTDDTVSILSGQNIAPWVSEPDGGQAAAINKGLARCWGEVLTYLCADDILEPGALVAVEQAFQENPDCDFVYGDAYFLEGDSGWKRLKRAGEFSPERLRGGNFLLQPAVFWRRSVYERFGGFDESLQYCLDHEYWLRTCESTSWHYLAKPLASCRLHGDAKTSRALAPAWAESAEMQKRYGILGKPGWEAIWMRFAGQYYYRGKRKLFASLGRLKGLRR